jgi:resolvase-like protein
MNAQHTGRYIAYYRVSTARQGRSGLGLEAQRQAVREHLDGGRWKLVAEFTEVESGKRSDRPKLADALKACRLQGTKLIIAKLDRLARNVAFISNLMESKVEFEAVDFPQANRLTIHIMAAIAEHEAKMIFGSHSRCPCGGEGTGQKTRRLSWSSWHGSRLCQSPTGEIACGESSCCRSSARYRGYTNCRCKFAALDSKGIKWTRDFSATRWGLVSSASARSDRQECQADCASDDPALALTGYGLLWYPQPKAFAKFFIIIVIASYVGVSNGPARKLEGLPSAVPSLLPNRSLPGLVTQRKS